MADSYITKRALAGGKEIMQGRFQYYKAGIGEFPEGADDGAAL